jgi:hypothetical protein
MLPSDAVEHAGREGVRCRRQPTRYISYTLVEDSMDQWTFHRRRLTEEELPDSHLRQDKVGELFPYDGYDGPRISPTNRMVAQFTWAAVGGPIYLYQSSTRGLYLYHYREWQSRRQWPAEPFSWPTDFRKPEDALCHQQ